MCNPSFPFLFIPNRLLVYLVAGAIMLKCLPTTAQTPPLITDLRSGQLAESSRLVIETTEIVPVSLLLLVDPFRLVVDMENIRLADATGKGKGELYSQIFAGYRFGTLANGKARLAIDLKLPATLERIYWLPAQNGRQRLLIDMADRGQTAFRVAAQALLANRHIPLLTASAISTVKPPPITAPAAKTIARITPPPPSRPGLTPPPLPSTRPGTSKIAGVSPPPSAPPGITAPPSRPPSPPRTGLALAGIAPPPQLTPPRRPVTTPPPRHDKWVVVIDAGHGGKDSGAIGVSGVKEKDITLSAAKELARQMEATGEITPILSRHDDRFHHLHKRVLFARHHQADVFISLHADAAPSARAHGVSVFTLSDQASDKEAEALAAQENKADLIGGPDLDTTDPDITPVLLRIFQREALNQSSMLADALLTAYQGLPTSIQRGHRFAGFAVLKSPDIPSVLIEMGFLTNRNDEQHLKNPAYRRDLLARTTEAVVAFLHRTTPALPSQVPAI